MHTDNVVIEEGGMRYSFMSRKGHIDKNCVFHIDGCSTCEIARKYIHSCCGSLPHTFNCISATKIQPEPKMYFAWNREEASHLVGKMVEFHTGACDSEWVTATLDCIDNAGSPFLSHSTFGKIIREAKTTKLTIAKLIEMAGIEGDVEIVEEGE